MEAPEDREALAQVRESEGQRQDWSLALCEQNPMGIFELPWATMSVEYLGTGGKAQYED